MALVVLEILQNYARVDGVVKANVCNVPEPDNLAQISTDFQKRTRMIWIGRYFFFFFFVIVYLYLYHTYIYIHVTMSSAKW